MFSQRSGVWTGPGGTDGRSPNWEERRGSSKASTAPTGSTAWTGGSAGCAVAAAGAFSAGASVASSFTLRDRVTGIPISRSRTSLMCALSFFSVSVRTHFDGAVRTAMPLTRTTGSSCWSRDLERGVTSGNSADAASDVTHRVTRFAQTVGKSSAVVIVGGSFHYRAYRSEEQIGRVESRECKSTRSVEHAPDAILIHRGHQRFTGKKPTGMWIIRHWCGLRIHRFVHTCG